MRMLMMLVVLAGCGGPLPVTGAEGLGSCGADKVQRLVGQPVAGHRSDFPDNARIIPPNSAVTSDYSAGRMNVDLDADGVIVRIWCG